MRKTLIILLGAFALFAGAATVHAGQMDVLVNKLVEKGVLTPYEAQILLAEAKEEAAKELAKGKAVTAPAWTQKIKVKGDVRFRTQTDWGKGLGPAHQRTRQRVRARLGVEGKVNDQVKAGMYIVTGGNDPRSTNQTLDDEFETKDIRIDGYYIGWTPQLPEGVGDGTLWLGKFKNPLQKSELLWDGDIWPAGIAAQYMSSPFEMGDIPGNLYANAGMLWLDEMSTSQRDPLMWVMQGGVKMDVVRDWGAKLNFGLAYYDLANVKGNQSANLAEHSAGTNTTWGGALGNTYRYDFNMLDFLIKYDSKMLGDFELGHGLYTDLIFNTDPPKRRFAWQLGGYIGKKKPKKPGQWKLWGEYRYIERDAVPDFMPDSDFVGFTTAGAAAGGGTNSQGVIFGVQYAIFKNTLLGGKYCCTWPLSLDETLNNRMDEPYQLLQMDVKVKF
ncbi:MAG: hypothetical protein GF409_06240 [Candidatus Omnitrophica bacterium]|nr:hypothetical protein [Candidatus Omnitrophota bacterium]